jgi:hypothetical protein
LISSKQHEAIEAALSKAAAAAVGAADTGDAMQVDVVVKPEEGETAAAAEGGDASSAAGNGVSGHQASGFDPVVMQLKRDLLRVAALLAETLKVGATLHIAFFNGAIWSKTGAAVAELCECNTLGCIIVAS